ncbi:MAG: ATP synthase subunit I [Candidatus Acidiferrum sp.]|jgi:hypothetical protein
MTANSNRSPDPTEPQSAAKQAALIGAATETRIAWLTIIFGAIAAIAAATVWHRRDWATGLAFGATLAWLNFRWLARGLDALAADSTAQTGLQKPQVPVVTYFLAAFRYVLIALGVYVIFKVLSVPLVSLLLGLCALGAATIAASIYEIGKPLDQRR